MPNKSIQLKTLLPSGQLVFLDEYVACLIMVRLFQKGASSLSWFII